MSFKKIADATIAPALYTSSLKEAAGTTGDIMQVVLNCYQDKNNQVQNFAPYLQGKDVKETCSNLWHFVKNNVRYKIDPPGEQWVKEPARVWADKVCDCKSYSVFIASCLKHLGIKGKFRFVSFNKEDETPTHVYIVVPYNGKELTLDCVLGKFNEQKPYKHKHDYSMTRISQLAGIPADSQNSAINYAVVRQMLIADRITDARNGKLTADRNKQYQYHIDQLNKLISVSGIGSLTSLVTAGSGLLNAASSLSNPISAGLSVLQAVSSLWKSKPNPNDWMGWDAQDAQAGYPNSGRSTAWWIITNGDSPPNEASNAISYILNRSQKEPDKLPMWYFLPQNAVPGYAVTPAQLYNKLANNGYPQQATQLSNLLQSTYDQTANKSSNTLDKIQDKSTTTKNMGSTLLLIGAAAGAAYFIFK